ncbi:MAG: hypothetical protein C0601_13655 [Candidatus Muiribacterium halophilum]|uniref:Organic solvent tolerance-like N-terminal domain-containing protein n=1 Tax=Muiribacterium halophilum TaxID=2053465 RepID=A0A2N5Z916_MUIH1|nr:MAG: hypothetical protein C0601_13655 [Candidatus Muirbacterium halophilum]
MKKMCFLFVIISMIFIDLYALEGDFIDRSKITGKVMEIVGSVRYIRGNFKIENPDYTLTAGQGKIDEKTNIMQAIVNVKLVQEKYTLTCNKLNYYIDEEKAVATGQPMIIERDNGDDSSEVVIHSSEVTGERIINFVKEDRVVVEDNVKVEKVNIEDGRKVLDYRLFCDNLTYYNTVGKAIAICNVKIERLDSVAYGDRLVFYEEEGRIEIVGNASVKRNNGDEVYGEKIVYFTDADRVLIFKAKAAVIPGGGGEK